MATREIKKRAGSRVDYRIELSVDDIIYLRNGLCLQYGKVKRRKPTSANLMYLSSLQMLLEYLPSPDDLNEVLTEDPETAQMKKSIRYDKAKKVYYFVRPDGLGGQEVSQDFPDVYEASKAYRENRLVYTESDSQKGEI